MAAHVLAYEDCPPHNIMHETNDYPLYYNALYFPKLHLSIFETLETVKAWLVAGIAEHKINCGCTPNNDGTFSVVITDDHFQISLRVQEASFTANYIESASFSFWCLARMAAWIMYSETHYKENLGCITHNILQASAQNVMKIVPHHKKDVVDCSVSDFMSFQDQFVVHNSDCFQMDSSNPSQSAHLLVVRASLDGASH